MTGTMKSAAIQSDQTYFDRRPLRATCSTKPYMNPEHFDAATLQRPLPCQEVRILRPPPPLPPLLPCQRSDSFAILNKDHLYGNCAAVSAPYPTSSQDGDCFANHHQAACTELCWSSGHQQQLPAIGGYFRRHTTSHTTSRTAKPNCSCHERLQPAANAATRMAPNEIDRQSFTEEFQSAYDLSNKLIDEEDSAFPALHEREFRILHRNIPALRRSGVDTTTIRQHFYPDGGWGWIICGVSFLVHILTSGLQLSFDLLLFYAIQHLHHSGYIEWLGALSWSISMLATPFVVTFCRKKSTRLMAIIGGLVVPLGVLFTSFATEFGQIIFSYGIVFALGVAMVRESSSVIMGNYFKRRRQFVEMVAMSGEGVGITLFSVILREGVGKAGWRLGLQLIAVLVSANFFMGMLYRPASLYHPQRRAIQHLKNQRRKMREKKSSTTFSNGDNFKTFLLDISSLKSNTVRLILLTSSVAAFGIYAPIFSMSISIAKEGSDIEDLVLLQTFLGISTTVGVILAGLILRKPLRIGNKLLTIQIITQVFISTIAIAMLFLSFVMGYQGLCILSWIYGVGFGGYRYSIKMLTLERVKIKHFTKAWGLIKGAESIPVLIGVPLTTFLNDYSLRYGRAGYYICSAAAAIAAITIFFLSYTETYAPTKKLLNGRCVSTLRCPLRSQRERSMAERFHDVGECRAPDLLHNSCINLNQPFEDSPSFRPFRSNTRRGQLHDGRPRRYGSLVKMAPHGSCGHVDSVNVPLRRSHSFMHSTCTNDGGRWLDYGSSGDSWNLSLLQQKRPLTCTCRDPALQSVCHCSSRSRSVPERLSSISQCTCSETFSRQQLYCPYGSSLGRFGQVNCAHCRTAACSTIDSRFCHPVPRSQSSSKPFQYVEQITTSV